MNKELLQLIADNISTGIDNATPSKYLRRISGLTERELRKCIEQMRRSGCVIISAPSGGYFKPEKLEEVSKRRAAGHAVYSLRCNPLESWQKIWKHHSRRTEAATMSEKRYYWLKLKEDFFDEKYIRALRKLPQGDSLVVVYLKMQLKSLKNEGLLRYEGIMPDCVSELAMTIDEEENVTRLAVDALLRFGVVERMSNDDLYMIAMQKFMGSEGSSAERMRNLRERHKKEETSQCDESASLCYGEIDIDKEIEKDIDKEIDKKPSRHKYGEYKNVLLSDTDLEKLKAEFPLDYEDRINRLSEYMRSTGKSYKDHLATIRSWARRDNKQQTTDNEQPQGKYYDPSVLEAFK